MNDQEDDTRVLDLDNVAFAYYRRRKCVSIFEALSLRVKHGERVAVVGESGGGKSTLLELASGIRVPSSGSVFLDGINLAAMSDQDRSAVRLAKIGFVRQDFDLLENLTAVQNVALAQRLRGSRRQDAETAAREKLIELGLGARLDHRPAELSGGEKQRVAIARAIIAEPSLVLADEPTGSLDAALRDETLDVLRTACQDRSLIVVTHDPQVAAVLADRILVLAGGHLSDAS